MSGSAGRGSRSPIKSEAISFTMVGGSSLGAPETGPSHEFRADDRHSGDCIERNRLAGPSCDARHAATRSDGELGAMVFCCRNGSGFYGRGDICPAAAGLCRARGRPGADGKSLLVHVNPWTVAVQGTTSTSTVQHVLRNLHRSLMLPTSVGIVPISLLVVPLLLTFATAFKVYKKWWRGFLRLPRPMRRWDKELRRYAGDLHRLADYGACGSSF